METCGPAETAMKPGLPNELWGKILKYVKEDDLKSFVLVNTFSFELLRHRAYRKVVFPSNQGVTAVDIVTFFERYGESIKTVMFPKEKAVDDAIFKALTKNCKRLSFVYSGHIKSIETLRIFCQTYTNVSFLTPLDYEDRDLHLPHFYNAVTFYKRSYQDQKMLFYRGYGEKAVVYARRKPVYTAMTRSPSACYSILELFNSTDPESIVFSDFDYTFLSSLQALHVRWYRNPETLYSPQVINLAHYCKNVRIVVVPAIAANALRDILEHWQSVSAICISSLPSDDVPAKIHKENRRAVNAIKHHRRVWCVDETNFDFLVPYWFIGVIPRM